MQLSTVSHQEFLRLVNSSERRFPTSENDSVYACACETLSMGLLCMDFCCDSIRRNHIIPFDTGNISFYTSSPKEDPTTQYRHLTSWHNITVSFLQGWQYS